MNILCLVLQFFKFQFQTCLLAGSYLTSTYSHTLPHTHPYLTPHTAIRHSTYSHTSHITAIPHSTYSHPSLLTAIPHSTCTPHLCHINKKMEKRLFSLKNDHVSFLNMLVHHCLQLAYIYCMSCTVHHAANECGYFVMSTCGQHGNCLAMH